MTPTPDLKAAALATERMYPDWPAVVESLTADGYISFLTDFIAAANPATILALIERLQVAEDAAKDAERLDFVLENDSFIHATKNDAGINVYQLWNQDEDEEYHVLSGLESFFPTKRKAIDAAIARRLTP